MLSLFVWLVGLLKIIFLRDLESMAMNFSIYLSWRSCIESARLAKASAISAASLTCFCDSDTEFAMPCPTDFAVPLLLCCFAYSLMIQGQKLANVLLVAGLKLNLQSGPSYSPIALKDT